jgi:hypothetical protein
MRDSSKDRLVWKWSRGMIDMAELGDPLLGSTDYRVCLYDETGGAGSLVLSLTALSADECGATCWKPKSSGYRYAATDGSTKLTLKASTTGKGSIVAKAKRPLLYAGPASGGQLVNQDTRVVIQLVSSTGGVCWESAFTSPATRTSPTAFNDLVP